MARPELRWSSVLVAMALVGCGGTNGSLAAPAADGGTIEDAAGTTMNAPFVDGAAATDGAAEEAGVATQGLGDFDLPMAVSSGGMVLANPRAQPVYFSGFPFAAQLEQRLPAIAASTYWSQVTSEYGVGPLTVLPGAASRVVVPAAITDADVPSLVQQAFDESGSTLGSPRGDTIYLLFLPPTTTLTVGGMAFCGRVAPSAYHGELRISGVAVPIVVVPTCTTFPGAPMLEGADVLVPALAHELIEAATDPFPDSAPAFFTTDPQHLMWPVALNGGEIADLCENEVPSLIVPADLGVPVPRAWSNVAARGLGGPCVPASTKAPYFAAVAHLADQARVQVGGTIADVPALIASVGASASVEVDFRAGTGAPSSWQALALEYHGPSSVAGLAARFGTAVIGHAGETHTIPVLAPTSGTSGVFPLITFSHASDGAIHLWVGAIVRR